MLVCTVCNHQICEDCLNNRFRSATKSTCFLCRISITRKDFISKYHEEKEIEKETANRKEAVSVFNKTKQDFHTLEEYNHYLEYVEDLVYHLNNEINTEETKAAIETERKEHEQLIYKNSSRYEIYLENLRLNALREDSIYDEKLKEEAELLRTEDEENVEVVVSEMPACMNLESVIYN